MEVAAAMPIFRPSVNFGRIVGFLVLDILWVSLDYGPIWTFNNQIILSFIFCLCTDLYVFTPWKADTCVEGELSVGLTQGALFIEL